MNLAEVFSRLARLARWHRRSLGILAAMVCLFATLSVLAPAEPETAPILVATRELPGGTRLSETDIRQVPWPVALLPAGALSEPEEVVGRTITGGLSTGSALTSAAILNGRTDGAGPGERLVPFRVPDAVTASLLQVGDVITVVGSGADGNVIELATSVRVAGLPSPSGSGGLGGGESGALIVVAADEQTAARLAAASTQMRMAIVLG